MPSLAIGFAYVSEKYAFVETIFNKRSFYEEIEGNTELEFIFLLSSTNERNVWSFFKIIVIQFVFKNLINELY